MSEVLAKSEVLGKAIIGTVRAIGVLGKEGINEHGRYSFVGIDKFYERCGKIAADHGLTWTLREVEFEMLPNVGKSGAIRVTYEVDMLHESGIIARAWSRISVLHPIQGAQTVGSAMSYADKIFTRQAFKVATGEKDIDADETDNRALDPALKSPAPAKPREPERRPEPKQEPEKPQMTVAEIEAMFTSFLPMAEDEDELKAFWSDNYPARNTLKDSDEDAYKRVLAAFSARKLQIKNNKLN